jgi:HD superfamily phosphohydrolase
MDRMDYLTRDSYYSGVAEGVIGYERIISMLNVVNNQIVVEEKGIYSVEKFLVARHIMYWQVYLHKTSLATEQMLKKFVQRLKIILKTCDVPNIQDNIFYNLLKTNYLENVHYIDRFTKLDDIDVYQSLKNHEIFADPVLSILANGIINRKLFKVKLDKVPIKSDFIEKVRQNLSNKLNLKDDQINQLMIQGEESAQAYNDQYQKINILRKDGQVYPITEFLDIIINAKELTKYFLCYPRV